MNTTIANVIVALCVIACIAGLVWTCWMEIGPGRSGKGQEKDEREGAGSGKVREKDERDGTGSGKGK